MKTPNSNSKPIDGNYSQTEKSIVLIGMMGVGKSSIGRRLAERLGKPFVDADDEIEMAANSSISDIFENYGEPHFRDGERRVIARLMAGEAKVIATGGGAFINEETRKLILAESVSIWLDADINILVERVSRRNHRPLLQGKDPRKILEELGKERNPIYALADMHIRSDGSPHTKTVDLILEALAK